MCIRDSRKDDSKGEYIIVFVTDVTMTPTKKTIDVKLLELPNNCLLYTSRCV